MTRLRRYRKPPVVEALCELYFHGSRWDETLFGRFFDRVQAFGFTRHEPVRHHEAEGVAEPDGEMSPRLRRGEPRMRFSNEARSRLIQLGRDLVVVNQLRPYPHFADWEPVVHDAARTYQELAQPKGLRRIGLRYINQVTLPGARVQLQDHFTVGPRIPPAWNDEHGAFMVRVETHTPSGMKLILTFGSAPAEDPGFSGFLLDLYAIVELRTPRGVDALGPALAEAHDSIEAVFEGSITQELRDRFEPEVDG